jgi:arginase
MRGRVTVGVPIDSLGKPGGTELAPDALRRAGVVEALGARDAGDLPVRIVGTERDPESGIVGYPTVVATGQGIRDGVAPLVAGTEFVAVLGGCCALIPGVAAALREAAEGPIGLAYIDGHMDTYTTTTSPTGEAADMPVAMVVGAVDPELTGLGPSPLIAPARIALLAHRDRDEAMGYGAPMPEDLGIAISHDCEAVQADPAWIGGLAAEELSADGGRFWLSIDVDVLSSEAFPATPVKQPGGLSARELIELARPLAQHPACLGVSVLCYDVDMDDAESNGARTVVGVLAGTVGS